MYLPLVLPLLAVLGGAWAPTAIAQDCPDLVLGAKVQPNAKRGILVGRQKAKITVRLRSMEAAQDVNFKMDLPAGLSVVKLKARPSRMLSPAQSIQNPDGTTAIYWTDFNFKKSSKRVFQAVVIADDCAPETLDVTALAYLVNATDLSAYCAVPLTEPIVLRVRYPGDKKTDKHASSKPVTCAPTPAPSVNPASPFQLFGEGQRCLQAGQLAPFAPSRRLSAPEYEDLDSVSDVGGKHRQLPPVQIDNPTECFEYCSINGNESTPFFFNWNTATNECFCCGGECTLILDPDFDAFKVVVAASASPTSSPSASPSASPSSSPTGSPSVAPSSSPSGSPSNSPSVSPSASPSASPSSSPTNSPSAAPSSAPTPAPICFNKEARVVMADSSLKPVHALHTGDLVSVDPHNLHIHAKVLALVEAPVDTNGGSIMGHMCELAPGFFLSHMHPLHINGTRWIRPQEEFDCVTERTFPSLWNIILEEGPYHTVNIEGFAVATWVKYPVGVPMIDRPYKLEMYRIVEQSPGFATGHVVIDTRKMLKLKTDWQNENPHAVAADASFLMPISSVHSSRMEL